MSKRKKQEPVQPESPLAPPDQPTAETATLVESGNGEHEQAEQTELSERAEFAEQTEEPAKMKVQIEGTAGAVRAAARKVANSPAPRPVQAPSEPEEPPDNTDELLADPRNMVVVRRQLPKSVELQDGRRLRTSSKMPEPYSCPTTREEIETDVFDNYGGFKYKCSIHPATTNGENTLLGAFTIEHPDGSETMPIIEGIDPSEPPPDLRRALHTSGGDGTMHDTDPYAKIRQDAERRLERAKAKKDALILEAEAKKMEAEIERIGNADTAPVGPSAESEEIRKLRADLAEKDRQLAEKKVNDQFDQIRGTLATLTQAITALSTAKPVEKSGESDMMKFVMKKMETDSVQITEMLKTITAKQAAPTGGADDLDKFLTRAEKLKALTGGDGKGNRLSELEGRLIDMSFDQLTSGGGKESDGGGGSDYEDVAKLAVKEFAPILKSLVETKMKQEPEGQPVSKEREKQIYAESAQAVAKKVHDDLLAQGIQLTSGPDGKLLALPLKPSGKVVVPPRATTKVVSEHRSAGGVVKKISIEPTDLMNKTQPPEEPAAAEGGDVKHGVFPLLGENGTTLKIPFPVHPGEMRYDRKKTVDFVLAGIRSEIRQKFPQRAASNEPVESYVASDAIEFLDDDLLNTLEAIDSGPQLEALLTDSGGDKAQIDEIKKAGEDEIVSSFLRRLIKTIQTEWIKEKAKKTK